MRVQTKELKELRSAIDDIRRFAEHGLYEFCDSDEEYSGTLNAIGKITNLIDAEIKRKETLSGVRCKVAESGVYRHGTEVTITYTRPKWMGEWLWRKVVDIAIDHRMELLEEEQE